MKLLEGNEEGAQAPPTKPNIMSQPCGLSAVTNNNSTTNIGYNSSSNLTISSNSSNFFATSMNQSHSNRSGNGHHYHHHNTKQAAPNNMSPIVNPLATAGSLDNSEDDYLEYTEGSHYSLVLAGINGLRRQGQFCDVKLVVGDQEFPVQRAVLAVCSPYLFDFLSCLEETAELQPTYKLKEVPLVGFQYLLEFMYTGSLCVPLLEVPVVYSTALLLRMESASRACSAFLSDHLTVANCLGIRQFTKEQAFKKAVDKYVRSNLKEIMSSKSFFGLTDLQVEVVGLDESISDETMERRLFSLVLDWAKNNLNDLKPKLDRLTEKVNVLYLESDNTLKDCAEDVVLSSDDDVVQDYKIMARRWSPKIKTASKVKNSMCATNGSCSQGFHKFSLNPEEAVSVAEREWSIVATRKTSDNAYLAIAILDGHLMAITVHVRHAVGPSSVDSSTKGSGSDSSSPPNSASFSTGNGGPQLSPVVRKATIAPLEGMYAARCALGAVMLNDQIVVCGGYDRGECLSSVEAFSLPNNEWHCMPSMNTARGRFSAAVLNNCIFVCGGSDGWKELSCVERFDPVTQKWNFMDGMIKERSSHGVATLEGKLYCVGGCEGQRSIAQCEVYDPSANKWSRIASLNTARSQTCVCAMEGLLFAIGGTDLWNTLNTVEVYNPKTDEWTLHSNLNIARRGAGVDIVGDMMVVVGGSDGTQSLLSCEIFDPLTDTWTVGPPLNTPRANLSAVVLGHRLFAVGGFSGKRFLPTTEWLDPSDMEWFGHMPREHTDAGKDADNVSNDVSEDSQTSGGKQTAMKDEKSAFDFSGATGKE